MSWYSGLKSKQKCRNFIHHCMILGANYLVKILLIWQSVPAYIGVPKLVHFFINLREQGISMRGHLSRIKTSSHSYNKFNAEDAIGKQTNTKTIVERIEFLPDRQMHVRLDVVAADLSRRHKSDDFNSFLVHLFFEGRRNKRIANNIVRCGMPTRKSHKQCCLCGFLWACSDYKSVAY